MSESREIQYCGSEKEYCEGYFSTALGNSYLLGVNYAVAKVRKQFGHEGSSVLDEINAFDMAEITNANVGQINAIKVSSFCGPRGHIWGYDICKVEQSLNNWNLRNRKTTTIANMVPIENVCTIFSYVNLTGMKAFENLLLLARLSAIACILLSSFELITMSAYPWLMLFNSPT